MSKKILCTHCHRQIEAEEVSILEKGLKKGFKAIKRNPLNIYLPSLHSLAIKTVFTVAKDQITEGQTYHFECPFCNKKGEITEDKLKKAISKLAKDVNTIIANFESGKYPEKTYQYFKSVLLYYLVKDKPANMKEILDKLSQSSARRLLSLDESERKFLMFSENVEAQTNKIILLPYRERTKVGACTYNQDDFQQNLLYIKHPYKDVYFPYESYEDELFKEETDELSSLLQSLGAKQVTVNLNESKSAQKSGKSQIGIGAGGGYEGNELKGKFSCGSENEQLSSRISERFKEKTFGRPTHKPKLHEEAERVFYSHRPDWKRIADNRIQKGTILKDTLTIKNNTFAHISSQENQSLQVDLKTMEGSANIGFQEENNQKFSEKREQSVSIEIIYYAYDDYKENL